MSDEEFKTLLETSGLPVAYLAFPEGEAPGLPFVCFLSPGNNNFAADGIVYFKSRKMVVELYLKFRDEEIEKSVEKALSSFVYSKDAEYLDDEKCWVVVYKLEV